LPEEQAPKAIDETRMKRARQRTGEYFMCAEIAFSAADQERYCPPPSTVYSEDTCATYERSGHLFSPALVAEYQTRLPDKKLLQAKLHEFYALTEI
jgi:hypothetical protein